MSEEICGPEREPTTFFGKEDVKSTVVIRDKTIEVSDGNVGKSDLYITADSETWLRFLKKEANLF